MVYSNLCTWRRTIHDTGSTSPSTLLPPSTCVRMLLVVAIVRWESVPPVTSSRREPWYSPEHSVQKWASFTSNTPSNSLICRPCANKWVYTLVYLATTGSTHFLQASRQGIVKRHRGSLHQYSQGLSHQRKHTAQRKEDGSSLTEPFYLITS